MKKSPPDPRSPQPDPPPPRRGAIALQLGYALLLSGLVLVPNLLAAPSLVLAAAAVLAVVWVLGCMGTLRSFPHSAELLLCGAAAPVVVGLTQLVYRTTFVARHGSPDAGFAIGWALETFLILLPGAAFVWRNARQLPPVTTTS